MEGCVDMEKVRFTLAKETDDISALLEKIIEDPGDITILAATPGSARGQWCDGVKENADQKSAGDNQNVYELSLLTQRELFSHNTVSTTQYYVVKPVEYEALMQYVTRPRGRTREALASASDPIADLLLAMGVPAHIRGYQFIQYAVSMVIEEPEVINRVTKRLYPGIAQHFDTTWVKVERSIRHAIEVVWSRGNIEALNDAYGFTVCTQDKKQTNSAFIALLANVCKGKIS